MVATRTCTKEEAEFLAEFVRFAVSESNQSEFARRCGISQAMVNYAMNGPKPAGGHTLRRISEATGIPIEDILSGVGVHTLRSRGMSGDANASARLVAAKALAVLFGMPIDEVMSVLDELGIELSCEASAKVWFDVGRAAIERKQAGSTLSRKL